MPTDDQDKLRAAYHTQINEVRNAAMRALAKANGSDAIDEGQLVWPVDGSPAGKATHMNAHTAVTRAYHGELRPFRDDEEDLWEESFDTLPRGDELGVASEISLATLDDWRRTYISRERRERHPVKGETIRSQRFRVVLPVRTLERAYDQLNDMLYAIGFAPEAASTPQTGVDTELLEEVEQWRKATLE